MTEINSDKKQKLYVVDAVHYLFRSYFAIRGMTNDKGVSTNALYGFIRSLQKLIKEFQPEHLICVFDGPENKKSRTALYADYKIHRPKMAEDLYPQIELAKTYLDLAGIPHLEVDGVEADDTIGSIAKWAEKQGLTVYLCSSDKDLTQLVSEHIFVLNTFKENLVVDDKEVEKQFGVRPEQMVDYLAIVGDSSDNIPGIAGLGPKAAVELLSVYGSLENLLENVESLENKKRAAKIVQEKENALLSQKLATIDTTVLIPHTLEEYSMTTPNNTALSKFYHEMHFTSLLKDLPQPAKQETPSFTVEVIKDQLSLEKMIATLSTAKQLCIDLETTSLSPLEAEIVGMGIAENPTEIFYIPFNGTIPEKELVTTLKPFLERETITYIGHNIKYDMHVLLNHQIKLKRISFDTMVGSYLLHAHEPRHNLDALAIERLNYQKIPIESLIGKTKSKQISMAEVPIKEISQYCAEDVFCTLRLKELFEKELQERNLWKLFTEIEIPLIPVLFAMERHGIFVDREILKTLSHEFASKIAHLEKEIFHLTNASFNLHSPKQLGEILFEHLQIKKGIKKTKTGFSTSADVLEALRDEHPSINLILDYRSLDKLKSTYVDALQEEINPRTKRIHCSFNQSVTATGRLSSTHPNLQNIPVRSAEGKRIREAFIPEDPNSCFLSADYSQIELRILAHFTEDPHLLKAFSLDEDIHQATAALVFDVPLSHVTKEMRFRAKAVNFGILYGQGAFGLSASLGIPFGEAQGIIDTYFKRYPRVKDFLEHCKQEAIKEGRSKTLFGRERLLPDINSKNGMLRSQALRLAVNTPIQGTQADIIKIAMLAIDKKIHSLAPKSALILQIHDELIFEIEDKQKNFFTKEVQEIMEQVVPLKVPLKVDISFGKNWGEC